MEGQINLFEKTKYKNPLLVKLEKALQELEARYRGEKLIFVLGIDLFCAYRKAEDNGELGEYLNPLYDFDFGNFGIDLKCQDGKWRRYSYLIDEDLTFEVQAVRLMKEIKLEEEP